MSRHSVAQLLILGLLALGPSSTQAAEDQLWGQSPYRVLVRVGLSGGPFGDPATAQEVANQVRSDLAYRVGSFWRSTVEQGDAEQSLVWEEQLEATDPGRPDWKPSEEGAPDKVMIATAVYRAGEVVVRAREYDTTLRIWGKQSSEIAVEPHQAARGIVTALLTAFRPLAQFEVDTDNIQQVLLNYRGERLAGSSRLIAANTGDLLTPYKVKYNRSGQPESAKRVAWTHLQATASDDGGAYRADVFSHTRLPFGSRRRGRVRQLAILIHSDRTQATELRLHAVSDPNTPLVGYELLIGKPGDREPTSVGRSDTNGRIVAPASDEVQMAHIKSGSMVVASFPIAPGVDPVLVAPLLDERQRLEAELRIGALREELIDLVARRSIYAARIRRHLEQGEIKEAEKLVRQLEALPGRAQFNQRISNAEQALKADHPVVQKRIDRLLSETKTVLGSSLDARQVRRLASEVLEAQRNSGG